MRRLVLGIAVAVTSLMPVMGVADDQQIADFVKSRLQAEQQQGNLRGFNVDMRVERGTVTFKGHVSNAAQEMTILKTAQQAGHLGVVKVVDDIEVRGNSAQTNFQQAGYGRSVEQQYAPTPAASPYRQASSQDVMPMEMMQGGMMQGGMMQGGAMEGVVTSGEPLPFASVGGGQAAMPMAYSSSVGGPSGAPNLPGYAWPGYAAHPNYGAVSYPKQYSASAWPYIGPFYPYPQVPLGWRKVSLEWDDGWWMLDFHDK